MNTYATTATITAVAKEQSVSLEQFLTYTAALIRVYGYVNSATAKEQGKPSTGQLAWEWATKGKHNDTLLAVQINYEDRATAQETVEWMKKLDAKKCGTTDYLIKLAGIFIAGQVTKNYSGYAASAITAWQRDTGRGQEPAQGNFLGKVGEKISVRVKFVRLGFYQGSYGESSIYNLEDSQGNKLSWSTLKTKFELGIEVGDEFLISGTVKKLSEWKGIKQTELTRCKVTK